MSLSPSNMRGPLSPLPCSQRRRAVNQAPTYVTPLPATGVPQGPTGSGGPVSTNQGQRTTGESDVRRVEGRAQARRMGWARQDAPAPPSPPRFGAASQCLGFTQGGFGGGGFSQLGLVSQWGAGSGAVWNAGADGPGEEKRRGLQGGDGGGEGAREDAEGSEGGSDGSENGEAGAYELQF